LFLTDVVPLVNIGTLAAFIVVSFAAIILRKTQPDIQRHFKTLLVPMIPAITIVFCILLVFELPTITQLKFIVWLAIGLVIYYFYGQHKNHLNKNQ
jgi:APA family basic amino acid/polyamine antiporter